MMRANLSAYESSNFASTPAAIAKVCAPGVLCTAAEQAQYDAGTWLWHVGDALPGGIAVMCMDSTPDDGQPGAEACDGLGLNTLKIFWNDSRSEDALQGGETFQRYVLSIVP